MTNLFQSTPPARGATLCTAICAKLMDDFNPRPPRGGRRSWASPGRPSITFQSTPPARGATTSVRKIRTRWIFQSTPPARGATQQSVPVAQHHSTFQSTPPARGATPSFSASFGLSLISIHAPREGGDAVISYVGDICAISIHAPREGGDFIDEVSLIWDNHFNPRPPRGGRRPFTAPHSSEWTYFNPRPPRGGRQQRCTVLPADL